jgi:hypothetical protein
VRQTALATRLLEQPVERRRRDAGLVLKLLGGDAGRCCTEDVNPNMSEDLRNGVRGRRLASTGKSDDGHDPVLACGDLANHPLLLCGKDDPVGALDLLKPLGADRGSIRVTAARDQRE